MDEQTKIALEKQNPWWFDRTYDIGISRLEFYPALQKYLNAPEVLLVLGARRTGKSTLLYQLIRSLKSSPEAILFINLDEALFQSRSEDPAFLSNLIEEYMLQHKEIPKVYVFIDEVQNYNYWVQTIKTFHDINKQIKFILTGSTSALLKTAASTRLSGRYFTETICPLSFSEFLRFNGVVKATILQKKQFLTQFLQFGAFPRVVLEKDETLKRDLLSNYFQTIYLKDIIYPHNLRNNKDVFDLLYFILSNIGNPLSYTSIGKILNVSTDTIKEYLAYAEESYLLYFINRYDPSVKKQLVNPRKAYCIDTGLINAVSFKFSENKGRIIENLVYIALNKSKKDIYYHKEKTECDFVLREDKKITDAIQVTVSLKDNNVKEREIAGLLSALNTYNLKEGTIITEDESGELKEAGKIIHILPLYEWLENLS